MPQSTDVHQLLLQVEASVAVAERNIRQLSRAVQDESTNMDTALAKVDNAHARMGIAGNNARIAMLELQHAVRGSVDAYASGANVTQILIQHVTMLGQAAYFASDSLGAFGKYLGGPWMLALTAGIALIGTLIHSHKDEADSLDALIRKQQESYEKKKLQTEAEDIFKRSVDGVIESINKETDELDKQNRSLEDNVALKQQQIRANEDVAKQRLSDAQQTLADMLARAQQLQQHDIPTLTAAQGTGGEAQQGANLAALQRAQAELSQLQTRIGNVRSQITALQEAIQSSELDITKAAIPLYEQQAADALDGIKAIEDKYKTLTHVAETAATTVGAAHVAAIKKIQEAFKAMGQELPKTLGATLIALDQMAKKEEDAWRAAHKNGSGNADFNAEIGAYYNTADKYRGDSETGNKGVLEQLFKEANINIDPQKVAWCAAFVNAILAQNGATGTGSLAASSFLNYGKDDIHSPQQGDIVVVRNSKGGDHVGFLQGYDQKTGAVTVLGGNTGNKVGSETFAANQVLAVRRPPTPSESAAATDKAAQLAATQQANFSVQLDNLNEQLLAIEHKAVGTAEQQEAIAEDLIRTEQQKYNDSVDKLVQNKQLSATDAAILKSKAAQLANERIQELQTQTQIKILQETIKSAELDTKLQTDHLRALDGLAKTQAEHRTLQLQMLDIDYKQKEASLMVLEAELLLAGKVREAADIQTEINGLPQEKADARAGIIKSTQGPWQSYLDSLPSTDAQKNEALQNIEVSGVQDLVDVLGAARKGWKAMRDAAINALDDIVGQLIKLKLNELIAKLFVKGGKTSAVTDAAGKGSAVASAQAAIAASGASLSHAGIQLTSAATMLDSGAAAWQAVAAALQAAAASLAAASAASAASGGGGGSGLGGLLGLLGGLGGGAGAGAAAGGGDIALSDLYGADGLEGLATGGWMPIGGKGGVDNNVLSINGKKTARVSRDEILAVIPKATMLRGGGGGHGTSVSFGDLHAPLIVHGQMEESAIRRTSAQHAANIRRAVADGIRKGLAH